MKKLIILFLFVALSCAFFLFKKVSMQNFDVWDAYKTGKYGLTKEKVKDLSLEELDEVLYNNKFFIDCNYINKLFLMVSVYNEEPKLLLHLLEKGADVNTKDKYGSTALMRASSYNKNKDIITTLLQNGANVNARNKSGDTALIKAVRNNNREVIKLLLDAGAEVNFAGSWGNTALIIASTFNQDLEVVKMLVEAGADINISDGSGDTALLSAINRNPNLDIARYLIEAGADVTARDNRGNTALIYLLREKAKLRIEENKDIEVTDIAKKLIDGGVPLYANNVYCKTAVGWARECKFTKIIELMEKKGLKFNLSNSDDSCYKYYHRTPVHWCRLN